MDKQPAQPHKAQVIQRGPSFKVLPQPPTIDGQLVQRGLPEPELQEASSRWQTLRDVAAHPNTSREVLSQEARRQEALRQEAEAVRREAVRQEALRREEALRQEESRQEALREEESLRQEEERREVLRQEALRQEALHLEQSREEARQREALQREMLRLEQSRLNAVHEDAHQALHHEQCDEQCTEEEFEEELIEQHLEEDEPMSDTGAKLGQSLALVVACSPIEEDEPMSDVDATLCESLALVVAHSPTSSGSPCLSSPVPCDDEHCRAPVVGAYVSYSSRSSTPGPSDGGACPPPRTPSLTRPASTSVDLVQYQGPHSQGSDRAMHFKASPSGPPPSSSLAHEPSFSSLLPSPDVYASFSTPPKPTAHKPPPTKPPPTKKCSPTKMPPPTSPTKKPPPTNPSQY